MRLMEQSGRSMVEILGMLAIAGVLSVGGVMGYKYAVDKNTANRIMNDVSLAYVGTSSSQQKNDGLMEYTDATSGYPTFTELIVDEDFQTDIVLVKQVPKSICDKILDMTKNSNWIISAVETDTNYLYPLTECEDMNAMVFSTEDVREFAYTCEKECPANMMCGVNDECICATGFEMDEMGNCIAKTCNLTLGPDAQPDRYCCEEVGGTWDYDAEPQVCGCDEGYFFNGKECAIDNWCSYKFTVPEMVQAVQSDCAFEFKVPELVQAVQSDCAFDFTVPETVTAGESEVSLTPVSGQTCGTGEYCVLNWTNGTCTSNVSTHGTNTTTRIYGRCAPLDEYYNICKTVENTEVSLTPVSGKTCGSGEYCILNWTNGTCTSNVGTYGINTTTTIYGRCAPLDETYNICKTVENGEVSLTPNKECAQENTYCSILWGNNSCQKVGTYGANTQTDLYGVCLSYDGAGDTTCPFQ